ncbi:MAG: hypothetical protein C4343_03925, partial [Chloroflexota bacterium]
IGILGPAEPDLGPRIWLRISWSACWMSNAAPPDRCPVLASTTDAAEDVATIMGNLGDGNRDGVVLAVGGRVAKGYRGTRCIVSYSHRPNGWTPIVRISSMWDRTTSGSGAVQSNRPSGPTMYPSSEAPIK